MRLENNFSLTSADAESKEELQEASSEVELHGYFMGGTRLPCAFGWHDFSLFEDTS